MELLFQRESGAEGDLDLFGRPLTQSQAELFLHERDDRLVELVAADAY